jgi:hypothetical protein
MTRAGLVPAEECYEACRRAGRASFPKFTARSICTSPSVMMAASSEAAVLTGRAPAIETALTFHSELRLQYRRPDAFT